jgi:hypothetical protein
VGSSQKSPKSHAEANVNHLLWDKSKDGLIRCSAKKASATQVCISSSHQSMKE